MRVFGLGQWVLDRYREKWLEGMAPSWEEARHFERRAVALSAVVCAMSWSVPAPSAWPPTGER